MDSLQIGRVNGITIRLNWSVLVIAALIAFSLAEAILPDEVPGRTTTAYWITGVITATAFFGALVAHELGHSLVAQRHGVEVKGITLWLLGGVAMLGSDPPSPKAAFRIAGAGPIVSAVLGLVAIAIAGPAPGLPGAALLWFGAINLLLAAFNLLPAYPLDGGRVYQAWQWGRTGSDLEATKMAVRLGRAVGAVFVVFGIIQALAGSPIGGIWLVFIGWFVRDAASAELRHKTIAGPLRHMTVADVMTPEPVTVDASMTVPEFVDHVMRHGRHTTYPLVDDGRLLGTIDVKDVLAHAGRDGSVGQFATPREATVCVEPTTSVTALLEELETTRGARALVCEGDRVVGVVSPTDVARMVAFLEMTAATTTPAR